MVEKKQLEAQITQNRHMSQKDEKEDHQILNQLIKYHMSKKKQLPPNRKTQHQQQKQQQIQKQEQIRTTTLT